MTIRFKSTGLPHLCSFSWFGRIAHGDAVAILLPECWRYYLGNPAVQSRTMELAEIFPGTTPQEVISSYEDFLDSIGMPGGLSAWNGIDAALIERTARSGEQNKMKLELAPRPVPLEESYDILEAIMKLSL
jgi:alcohol dehydrogenase class IV